MERDALSHPDIFSRLVYLGVDVDCFARFNSIVLPHLLRVRLFIFRPKRILASRPRRILASCPGRIFALTALRLPAA